MITEDYCSYEVAKLLKEKGFPQEYDIYQSMVYNEEDYEDEYETQRMILQTQLVKAGTLSSYPVGVPEPKCYCPTHQMAMKWLRETHNIIILICPLCRDLTANNTVYTIDIATLNTSFREGHLRSIWSSYEKAIEAALKYSLENLI